MNILVPVNMGLCDIKCPNKMYTCGTTINAYTLSIYQMENCKKYKKKPKN